MFYIDPVLPVLPGLQWCERPEELDNLDEHPVVGGGGHELEEGGGQGQIVLGVLAGQLTDHVHSCRLGAAATTQAYIWPTLCRFGFRAVLRFRICPVLELLCSSATDIALHENCHQIFKTVVHEGFRFVIFCFSFF